MIIMMMASTYFFNPLHSKSTTLTNNNNNNWHSCPPRRSYHRRRHAYHPSVCAEGNHANNYDIEPSTTGSVSTGRNFTVSSATAEERSEGSGFMKILECTRKRLGKMALAAAMTGLLIFGPTVGAAMAAKSGGRVGGQAFRSSPPSGSAGPRIDNSRRSNIYINPSPFVAPPLYGPPYLGGGWGWSPFSFFAPGPGIAVEVGSGFNLFGFLLLLTFLGSILNSFRKRNDNDYYD